MEATTVHRFQYDVSEPQEAQGVLAVLEVDGRNCVRYHDGVSRYSKFLSTKTNCGRPGGSWVYNDKPEDDDDDDEAERE